MKRIVFVHEKKFLNKQAYSYDSQLSILFSSSFIENLCISRFRNAADRCLKNHYIILNKTPINDGKNTYTKQFCNHKEIN
jgi:hypothetical protein